ncbi:chitinase-3-like protein 1 [Dermacentor variabilis]|uniref:chitinase-3-like protein 1 n=1 Tax=Dermacentor variabilis TaxID=34621 RepID=UPI003F5B6B7C
MENEETTLVGQRASQQVVDLGDPFINSALVHTASACLIFVVVFIFVLPGILLTTLRREKPYQVDMRPKTRLGRQVYEGPDRPLIMCMVNSTSFQRLPPMTYTFEQVPSNLCSHVVFPLSGAADWSDDMLHYDYTHKITHPNLYREMVRLKKERPALKILVGVGEYEVNNGLFRYAAESMHATVQFCSAVLRWTLGNGFDGLVIHRMFTSGSPGEDRRGIIVLLQKLWVHFERHGLTLVVVFEPETEVFNQPLLGGKICSYVDYAVVVAHGFRSDAFAEFPSPMRSRLPSPLNVTMDFDTAVQRALASGVPVHKLVVSVSLDGASYTLDDKSEHKPGSVLLAGRSEGIPGLFTRCPGVLSFFEICRRLVFENWTRAWDASAECPYAYSDDQWVAYEDQISLMAKAEYVRNRSLAGMMVWDVSSDDYRGDCGTPNVLVQTIYQNFQSVFKLD